MRGAPQVGFSAIIRKISSRTSVSSLRLHNPQRTLQFTKPDERGFSIFLDSHACRGGQSGQIAIPLEVEYVPTTTASWPADS